MLGEMGTTQQQKFSPIRQYMTSYQVLLAKQWQNMLILHCKSVQNLDSLCKKVGFSL